MDDATLLFNKVFFALTGTWSDVMSFRQVMLGGVAAARERLLRQNAAWFEQFVNDPANDQVFVDKGKYLERVGGFAAVAVGLTKQQIQTCGGSVDSASIVFMHSALDGALHDLCRATALVAPQRWQQFVDGQEERLGVLRDRGYEAVAKDRIAAFVTTLSYESMLKKTDRLFQVCEPDRAYSRIGYRFDKARLAELDDLRHDIVHRNRPRTPIHDVDAGIEYLSATGLFFFGMVNHCFGLTIDPQYHHERIETGA